MTDQEAARWNSRYSKFVLTRYSRAQQKFIQVGKPRPDIRAALKAAAAMDARNPEFMTFVDIDMRSVA